MNQVQKALAAAGYVNTARFLGNATLDDLRLARCIVSGLIEITDEDTGLLCAEAVRELDRAIKEAERGKDA